MLFSKADGGREVSRDPPTPTPAPPVLEEDRENGRLYRFVRFLKNSNLKFIVVYSFITEFNFTLACIIIIVHALEKTNPSYFNMP